MHFYFSVFMELISKRSRYALQEHLHLISAPLQIIWGKQDQVWCKCVAYLASKPSSKCIQLSGIADNSTFSTILPGGGCLWRSSHPRKCTWVQGGPAGELWPLRGDGKAPPHSETHIGVHHLKAKHHHDQEVLVKREYEEQHLLSSSYFTEACTY